jgi:hypothetical protein
MNSCFHGKFLGPHIEFMHSSKIYCEQAVELFRAVAGIWKKIGHRYGKGSVDFWVIFDYSPENPVIASCCRNGVYFNLALERSNLTPEQDLASRIIEELYHLHEWRVRSIVPEHEVSWDEKFGLTEDELLAYYSQPHEFRALDALCAMTGIAYWKDLRKNVVKYAQGS